MFKSLFLSFLLLQTLCTKLYSQQNTALKQFNRYVLLGENNIEFHQNQSFDYLDSATVLLPKVSNKTALANYYFLKGKLQFAHQQHKLSLGSLKTAEQLYEKINHKKQAIVKMSIARTFEKLNQLDSSLNYWNNSLSLSKKFKDSTYMAKSLLGMGDFAYYHSTRDKSIRYYFDALNIAESIEDVGLQAECLSYIGYIFEEKNELERAKSYYLKSIKLAKINTDVSNLIYTYGLLANLYASIPQGESKAFFFMKEREKLVWQYPTDHNLSRLYADYGALHYKLADYNSAITNFKKALVLNKTGNSNREVSRLYYNIASAYGLLNKYEMSIQYHDSALVLGLQNKDKNRLWYVYWDLAHVYANKGDFKKAYENYQKYVDVNETILNEDYQNQLAEMSTKYDSEKKEAENIRLRKELLLKQQLSEKERNQRYLLGSILLLVTISLFITIRFYRMKQRDNRLLKQQKEEIEQKTETLNKQAAEISKYRTQMNPHFIFNALNSVQHFILKENKNSALDYLNDFSRLMRLTLYNSDKDFITLNDEKDFLSFYVNFEQQRFKDKFEFNVNVDPELDLENVLIAPMLIQPFVENAIKHAGLSSIKKPLIEVSILLANDMLHVSIEDNGKGRSFDKISVQHESKGIDITRLRIEALFKHENKVNPHQLLTITDKIDGENQPCGVRIDFYVPLIENF